MPTMEEYRAARDRLLDADNRELAFISVLSFIFGYCGHDESFRCMFIERVNAAVPEDKTVLA